MFAASPAVGWARATASCAPGLVALSWDGHRVPDIAAALGCHPKTVRARLARFDAAGVAGLRDGARPGRARRITEAERSRLIRLVRHGAAGLDAVDEAEPAYWTLDTLTEAAIRAGIAVARSQLRRILRAEQVRWRQPRAWATSVDPEFDPKGPRS